MSAGVHTIRSGAVLEIRLDRPRQRNAVNGAMARGIAAAMDELDGDRDLRAGILYGAGGTFCAGMDLKAFAAREVPTLPGRGFAGLVEAPPSTPLIAAVEGFALAGGLEVALACDLVVAALDAQFGLPEVTRGLVAAGGGLLRLPERVPSAVAMDLALTGRRMTAQEAERWGLVCRIAAPGSALAQARVLAAEIVANAPLAVRATKHVLSAAPAWPREERFERQREIVARVRSSADALEGARAFAERRAPRWTGA